MIKRAILFVCVLPIIGASRAGAEPTPAQTRQAEALIQQFSAREFVVRQRAVDGLITMGPDVLPLVRKALTGTRDPEVKLRCEMVVTGIRRRYDDYAAVDDLDAKFNTDASTVTLDVTKKPLADVLRMFAEQTTNTPMRTLHEKDAGRPVTLKLKDVPYWQALDALCEATGLTYQAFGRPGVYTLELLPFVEKQDYIAYTGPVVVRVTNWLRLDEHRRRFRVVHPRTSPARYLERQLFIRIGCHHEPRLPVIGRAVWCTEVLNAKGHHLLDPKDRHRKDRTTSSLIDIRFTFGCNTPVKFVDDEKDLTGPLTVRGVVRLDFGVTEKALKILNVFAGGTKADADDRVLDQTALKRDRNTTTIELDYEGSGASGKRLLWLRDGPYGFALVNPQGRRYSPWRLRWRSNDLSRYSNGDVCIIGTPGRPLKGKFSLDFSDLFDVTGSWTLVYTYPAQVWSREYPFVIQGVPLD